jgi:hypothetical protein
MDLYERTSKYFVAKLVVLLALYCSQFDVESHCLGCWPESNHMIHNIYCIIIVSL